MLTRVISLLLGDEDVDSQERKKLSKAQKSKRSKRSNSSTSTQSAPPRSNLRNEGSRSRPTRGSDDPSNGFNDSAYSIQDCGSFAGIIWTGSTSPIALSTPLASDVKDFGACSNSELSSQGEYVPDSSSHLVDDFDAGLQCSPSLENPGADGVFLLSSGSSRLGSFDAEILFQGSSYSMGSPSPVEEFEFVEGIPGGFGSTGSGTESMLFVVESTSSPVGSPASFRYSPHSLLPPSQTKLTKLDLESGSAGDLSLHSVSRKSSLFDLLNDSGK